MTLVTGVGLSDGRYWPSTGRDRDERLDVEPEVELDGRVVGIVRQTVERGRNRHRLTTARVPHERDAIHVDLALQR